MVFEKRLLLKKNTKMKIFKIAVILFMLTILFSCENKPKKSNSDPLTFSLRQGWWPWAGYAGELIAMYDLDSINGVDFKIKPGADDIDPMKMVLSGSDDFGITSAEAIMTANEKGANLVAIGVVNYKSPTCFISLKSSNIKTPIDFENKKVGILTGSETETVYRTLVNKLDLNESKITEIEAPYDLKTFINKAYDVYPGFIYSETIALDFQSIEYDLIKPEDYGVELIGAIYFTTKSKIDKNPEMVQSFVNIVAEGWEIALKNPEKAIGYLDKFDKSIDEQRELISLKKGIDYFGGENHKVLFASANRWNDLKTALIKLKKIKGINIDDCFDNSFINEYHKKKHD
jgi:NitT/TauT family transport system substrate-binding protein